MTTIAIILIILIFCYFGHMVTTDCADVADFIYDAAWYRYPLFLQKSILFIVGRAHLPFYFTAYKMYKCTLQSFSGVCIEKLYTFDSWLTVYLRRQLLVVELNLFYFFYFARDDVFKILVPFLGLVLLFGDFGFAPETFLRFFSVPFQYCRDCSFFACDFSYFYPLSPHFPQHFFHDEQNA